MKELKQKSIFSYTLVGLIFIAIISTTIFLIYTQKSSAKQVDMQMHTKKELTTSVRFIHPASKLSFIFPL